MDNYNSTDYPQSQPILLDFQGKIHSETVN